MAMSCENACQLQCLVGLLLSRVRIPNLVNPEDISELNGWTSQTKSVPYGDQNAQTII